MATCRMEPCQRTDHRLDVTIQAQILDLLMSLKDEYGLSVLFITHDFGVVAQIADKVAVMYAGRLLETGDVYDVFDHPAHPYTAGLLKTRPVIGRAIGATKGKRGGLSVLHWTSPSRCSNTGSPRRRT